MTMQNQTYYLHYDQVGTLKAVTDKNQNIIKEISYDTYGNILLDTNTDLKIPFGFAGGLHDRDTNLVHFGYREYEPLTGKWTAKDPIDFSGGDSNLYGYVLNDPVNFVDPKGLINDPVLNSLNNLIDFGKSVGDIANKIGNGVCRDVPKALKNAHNSLSNLENNINKTKTPISRELGKMLFNKTQVNSSQILNADSMYSIIQGVQQ